MTIPAKLRFDEVNEYALARYPGLLEEWLPGGKVVGGQEYEVRNPTRGDRKPGSFEINIRSGQWLDGATGDKGGDPISLYAYLNCGGTGRAHRVQACKLMAAEFGLSDDIPTPRPVKRPPRLELVPKKEPEEWQPIVPPPDDVAAPNLGYDHVFKYLDRDRRLLRYVVRNDAKAGRDKWVRPLTYGLLNGKPSWELRGPNNPKSLYGLERLDGRPWLLFEGEKKCDQVQALLPGYACLSLTGGAAAINHNDLTPLAGTAGTYCPDNDAAGRKAADVVCPQLVDLKSDVMLLDVFSHGFPEKWDLGDAVENGWSVERIEAFIRENGKLYDPDPGNVDLEEPQDDDAEWKEGDDGDLTRGQEGVIPLGHDNGLFYYLSLGTGQVHALTPARHVELELTALADPDGYWRTIPMFCKDDKEDWDPKKSAQWMMKWCRVRGIYNPDRIRGRGAWLDTDKEGNAHAVFNLGESLIVDGVWQKSLKLGGSSFVYVAAAKLNQTVADPLRNAEAHKLLKMCELLRWEKKISARLAAGFIVVSIICGTLHWRPSVWVTGGSNSGKTTFLRDIVLPILGKIAVQVQSKTTEAGLRQILGSDARPVIFDEAEAEMLADKTRMQGNIDLVRQSSSEGGAEIIKGTQNQSGAKRYRIRSCFMFSSINVSLDHLADESRITVLDLYNPGPGEMEADRQRWLDLLALMAETVKNPDWCAGMVSRSVKLMHVIRANAATFKVAVSEKLGSSRVGDQLGTLLAGAYSLASDKEISLDEARAWLDRPENDLSYASSAEAAKDEERLTSRLMQQRMKVDLGDRIIERNVGDVIAEAEKYTGTDSVADVVAKYYLAALKAHGMKLEDGGVWFSNTHKTIGEWLKDSPWSSQWYRSLKRLAGAKSSEPKVIVFGKHDRAKAVWVPLPTLEGNDLP